MKKVFYCPVKITVIAAGCLMLLINTTFSQSLTPFDYVNPFIGTAKSDVLTKWGGEGGTFPGAVAPSGFLQLTPETRITGTSGYNYPDSLIYFFSCFNHSSGFPSGSSGQFHIMPVDDTSKTFEPKNYNRPFSHQSEKAVPGYYRVAFTDNKTITEVTASPRTGMFRFTFPAHVVPKIFIGDAGKIRIISATTLHTEAFNGVINLDHAFTDKQEVDGGFLLSFPPAAEPVVIVLKISGSTVSNESAQKNIDVELHETNFDQLKERTHNDWLKELSVVEIDDSSEKNKTIFYTAIYHSLLIPWVISDVEGNYRGHDRLVHKASGKKEYGKFSPWDTFRSLHPMLSLLYPEKQSDIVVSIMDIYKQTGHLPTESMTGNHSIPILVDAYFKGIRGIDSNIAYVAMKKDLVDGPFEEADRKAYSEKGYIPFTYPESVTRTVEYAYDDWALAEFANRVMHKTEAYRYLLKRSYAYQHLFNAQELCMLPRNDNEFKLQPGNSGYKEGDQWVYAYFAPQDTKDLINLMGGNLLFSQRLDAALTDQQIIFDNETVFHIPYLFNEAGRPQLTQKWVKDIMLNRFGNSPGGLPGNDDLGATSSWYVLSAMGLFPLSPGRPLYTIGSPMFRSLTIHLANGKQFVVKSGYSASQNIYVQSLSLNNHPLHQSWITHTSIINGGSLVFTMGQDPPLKEILSDTGNVFSETKNSPVFMLSHFSVPKKKVNPDEPFRIYFSVTNKGATGTKIVKLKVNGKESYASKNCFVQAASTVKDSMECRLYPFGKTRLQIEGINAMEVEVVKASGNHPVKPGITNLIVKPVIRMGDVQQVSFSAKNIGGAVHTFIIPVMLNDSLLFDDTLTLLPGEEKMTAEQFKPSIQGIQTIRIENALQHFKVFRANKEAEVLSLDFTRPNIKAGIVNDQSGFSNNGKIISPLDLQKSNLPDSLLLFGKDCFVEVPNAPSLDQLGESITMMVWVYPTEEGHGLTDLFTKGDNHVLQVSGNRSLTFFAGGWGRGDVTVDLPANWINNWHHLAGVCDGKILTLYIDGILKGTTVLETSANLSVANKWTFGRNEEFPLQRIFHGYMKKAKVFVSALSADDIMVMMNE